MLTLIVFAVVLYGPLFWVIRAGVREGILAADERRRERAAQPVETTADQS